MQVGARPAKNAAQRSFWEKVRREFRTNWGLYLLVAIPVAYLIIFKYVPMYGVQIAFRDYTPVRSITGSPWVGWKHFQRFFNNPSSWSIIRNTLSISLYSLLTFPLPIVLALLLNYMPSQRFKKTVQLVSYAPHFISTVVMVGIILQFLDTRSGLLNMIITSLGGDSISFMSQPKYFYHIYVWSGVWQGVGYSSIIYIAALAGVSPELHEAAIVDGANILKRMWHIDLPSLLPTVSILLIMQCGSILSVGYEKIYLMQNNLNSSVSEVISTYVYKQGIAATTPQYSYATAIGLFVSLINVILLITVNKITGKLSGSSLW
ncbi:MAG: ABC transporter permease [Candidatus Merdivicinus sp.]|jgi:putative aldouronate transport system permease protein